MLPVKQRGGPEVTTPQSRPNADLITDPASVNHGEAAVADRAAGPRRASRAVRASVYAPHPGRSWWWLAYICPHCGAGHLGRARTEAEVPGPRRSRCGHLVVVVVARVYGQPESGAA